MCKPWKVLMQRYQNYIDGEWVAAADGREIETENPYTRTAWATIARSSATDVDHAVEAASRRSSTGRGAS
jgi:acyl-CoA reductase-like NAD-dependent aldehyde dehydrogenase